MYTITAPNGKQHRPPAGSCWKVIEPKYKALVEHGLIYFGKDGNAVPSRKQYLSDIDGVVPWTWWPHEEAGHNDEAKRESQILFGTEEAFGTPKPERLLFRIIHIATDPGDLVLDSFAGSGTTGAVAHKMGRRWIMAETGVHARSHIIPRLQKVIAGEDPGGVTAATGWQGGGAFRFCRLAPSLIARDRWGREVISPEFDGPLLAQALCKLDGYRFEPSESEWWIHGRSSETDFLHVTTQTLSYERP
jgi:adenine-specific DNA-methyltransferase